MDGHGRKSDSIPGGSKMVWLPIVSWGKVAQYLGTQAVAPSGEELDVLVTRTIPSLSSMLGVHIRSWWGRCQPRLPALPLEAEGGECAGSCH